MRFSKRNSKEEAKMVRARVGGRGVEELERRVLLSAAIAALGGQQTFLSGFNPHAVALGDVNRDGKLDAVVANNTGDTVSVLLNDGTGQFPGKQAFAAGDRPIAVAVGDVNGDGKSDVVVADYGGTVSVLAGNGDGTFGAPATILAGGGTIGVAVGDVNGDGKLDILAANYGGTVSVLLGNGNGTFSSPGAVNAGAHAISVAVADFNGDGKPDLAVANYVSGAGTVSVMLGNRDGTFAGRQTFATGSKARDVVAADMNRDGKLDLVVSNYGSGSVSVLLGNGDGTFGGQQVFTTDAMPRGVAVADMNVDGKLDVVTSNGYGSVSVLLGNGDGMLAGQKTFGASVNPYWVAAGDVNGDGRPDVVVANQGSNNIGVMLGDVPPVVLGIDRFNPVGANTSASTVSFSVTFSQPVTGVDASDFVPAASGVTVNNPLSVTGSDAQYTVTVSGIVGYGTVGLNLVDDGSIRNVAGNPLQPGGIPRFGSQQTVGTSGGANTVVTDLNRDGKPDLILAAGSTDVGTAKVLLGNGDGTFQTIPTSVALDTLPYYMAAADVNGDGKVDLFAGVKYGRTDVLLGNGDGTFQARKTLDIPGKWIVLADVNGDGKADLVTSDRAARVYTLLGNGDGSFRPGSTVVAGLGVHSIVAADVNGDGKLDLALGNYGIDYTSVLLGNGDGAFQAPRTFYSEMAPGMVAVADVNHDGKPDLVTNGGRSPSAYGCVSVLLGNGNGSFQPGLTYFANSILQSMQLADVNRDGNMDVVAVQDTKVTVLFGNSDGSFKLPVESDLTSPATVLAVEDLNGDARPDLVIGPSVRLGAASGDTTGQTYQILQTQDTITGSAGADGITLKRDSDHVHIDWTLGTTTGVMLINDANGLTIIGNGGHDVISLDYSAGNPLPNLLSIKQPQGSPSVNDVTINGIDSTHLLSGTTIDINTSKVFLKYASAGVDPMSSVLTYLQTGRGSNTWTGTASSTGGAIRSSAAATNPGLFAIGYADNATDPAVNATSNSIELMYTINGDANLDGQVTLGDFSALSTGFGNGTRWTQADFNYDQQVTLADFSVLSTNFGQSLPAGGPAVAATSAAVSGAAAVPGAEVGGVVGSTAEAVNAGAGRAGVGGDSSGVADLKRKRRGKWI